MTAAAAARDAREILNHANRTVSRFGCDLYQTPTEVRMTGRTGVHTIERRKATVERVAAHWLGFVQSNA